MNEKFSVIIPLLNKAPSISRAIDSVLHQTIQNFEIIVIDGGSHDNGPQIVNGFHDPRIHFIIQNGKGVSNARNEAVNTASCDYIAFLDADDEWMPKHLEIILRLIEKFPEAGMYTTAYKRRTLSGKTRWDGYKFIPDPPWEGLIPDYFKSGAFGCSPVWTSVVVIPKKIFYTVGGFPEGYWWGEDADLFGKIALKFPVAFSWEIGAIYHTDDLNRLSNRAPPLEEPFMKTARAALFNGEVPSDLIESLNEYIAKKEIFLAEYNVHAGNLKNAQIILKKCDTKWFYYEKIKWLFITKIPPSLFLFLREIRRKLIIIVRKLPFVQKSL
jgi:glycosyltransferase involved in cell wall biosynthesis